jgi:hypothetical protein
MMKPTVAWNNPARLLLLTSLALSACGGGGGGGGGNPSGGGGTPVTGNGFAPATGPGDTSHYFPQAQGNNWSFNFLTNDPTAITSSAVVGLAVTGTKTVQGVTATVLTRTDPTLASGGYDQYFYVNAGGVTNLGNTDSTDTISPLIVPYVQLLFPVQIGPVSSLTGTNLPFGKDSSGNPVTLNLTQNIANIVIESIDVPAGTYSNALRQTTAVTATAYDGGQPSTAVSGTDTSWLVPGIGQIKEQISTSASGSAINSSSELRGFAVNGEPHGLGAAADLVPTLLTANCTANQGSIGPPSLASDGTNTLLVAHQCNVSNGNVTLQWLALLVGPDGTIKNSVNLSAVTGANTVGTQSTVAFDGTNYLVVHEEDSAAPLLGVDYNLDALLISQSGAIVSGPNVVGLSYHGQAGGPSAPALAFDGNRYLLAFPGVVCGVPPQLCGLFINPATGMANTSAFQISNTNDYDRGQPAIGFDGTNYLIVWTENGSNPPGLVAVRVTTAGIILDATPLLIANNVGPSTSGAGPCCDLQPAVSFDGTNYLVTYLDQRNASSNYDLSIYSGYATISAARVSPAGVLLDGSPTTPGIVVTTAQNLVTGRVSSAFINGAHWLVWDSGNPRTLYASRVSTAGTVPAVWPNGFPLLPPVAAQVATQLPAIAPGNSGGLVTWLQGQPSSTLTALFDMPIYSSGP